jgi:hypothetical protein
MFDEGFWNRFAKKETVKQVVKSTDFLISLVLTLALYYSIGANIMDYNVSSFVSGGTSISKSLIAVALTGVAILVALTDKDILALIHRIDVYDSLMITFEYTIVLSIILSAYGTLLTLYDYGHHEFYLFLFLFSYLLLATANLASDIVTFGEKISQIAMIENLPDDISDRVQIEMDLADENGDQEKDDSDNAAENNSEDDIRD